MRAWKSNYIPLCYLSVITYQRHNPDGGSANHCWVKGAQYESPFHNDKLFTQCNE